MRGPDLTRRILPVAAVAGLVLLAACSQGGSTSTPAPESNAPLFLDVDTVLGPTNLTAEERPSKTCVQMSRFAHNEEVVWRVKVLDPRTGEPMDDTQLESVQVQLPDETLDMHYGGHPNDNPADFFWTVSWDVPEDYPSGNISYAVKATATDGRTGTWDQFGVTAAQLTVTDEVRPVIEEQ